jgi:drug/metabolite transporter (DMT)-like permease
LNDRAAILIGIASALSWGAGDFCGGLATRRSSILPVLAVTEGAGLVLLLALALLFGEPLPSVGQLGWSVAAGLAGMLGLAALYQGLATGSAAVVAPTSAVIAAAIPVAIGTLSAGLPGPAQAAGFGAGLLGIWLVAGGQGAGAQGGRGLALLAGLGFGLYFVLIHQASTETAFWTTAAARGAALLVVLAPLLQRRTPAIRPRAALALALLAGVLDAGGNAFFVLAGQAGRLDVAALLASLYPAATVLLGRVVLAERVTRAQSAGLAAALAAIVLIAL